MSLNHLDSKTLLAQVSLRDPEDNKDKYIGSPMKIGKAAENAIVNATKEKGYKL